MTEKAEETVKVMVRVRPMNKAEKQRGKMDSYLGCKSIISMDQATRSAVIHSEGDGRNQDRQFTYD
jgi:hypothetical protein